jgi:hypothetical protein
MGFEEIMSETKIHHDLSIQRRVDVAELLVSRTLHERLQPRALRLALSKIEVEIRVSIAVNTILRRPVFLSFVGVVEPKHC